MRTLGLLLLCLFLCSFPSCPDSREVKAPAVPLAPPAIPTPLPSPEPPKAGRDGKVDPLEQAKYDQQRYAEALAAADKRVEVLTKQYEEAALKAQVIWITGLCLIFAAICGVLVFVVPVGKKTLAGMAVGFTTVAACAQAFKVAVPYLPWIGGVIVIGGAVLVAINWRKLASAVKVAAGHADRIETWLQDLPTEARTQALKIVEDAKSETQQQAHDLGVHAPLQYLRGKAPSLWQRIINRAV